MLHMQKAAFAIFLLSLLSSCSGEPPTLTDEDWGDSIESIDVEGEQKLKMASRTPEDLGTLRQISLNQLNGGAS